MSVLNDFYYGYVVSLERFLPCGKNYSKSLEEFNTEYKKLSERLDCGLKSEMDNIMDLRNNVYAAEMEEFFVYAFRLGAKTALDMVK